MYIIFTLLVEFAKYEYNIFVTKYPCELLNIIITLSLYLVFTVSVLNKYSHYKV